MQLFLFSITSLSFEQIVSFNFWIAIMKIILPSLNYCLQLFSWLKALDYCLLSGNKNSRSSCLLLICFSLVLRQQRTWMLWVNVLPDLLLSNLIESSLVTLSLILEAFILIWNSYFWIFTFNPEVFNLKPFWSTVIFCPNTRVMKFNLFLP